MKPDSPVVDLRSDTVTRPTPGMRRAIARAEVGDDVFGDDPTVQALEQRVAELAGKPSALFVPSGTMGNQIAIRCHTEPGDEVLLESQSHIFLYEQGGIAANSGALAHVVDGERGVIAPEQLSAAIRGEDDHRARLALRLRLFAKRIGAHAGVAQGDAAIGKHFAQSWHRRFDRIAYRGMRGYEPGAGLVIVERERYFQRAEIGRVQM